MGADLLDTLAGLEKPTMKNEIIKQIELAQTKAYGVPDYLRVDIYELEHLPEFPQFTVVLPESAYKGSGFDQYLAGWLHSQGLSTLVVRRNTFEDMCAVSHKRKFQLSL